eukprot:Sspe_Gene.61424::Locus_34088_Transcript_2_6_Confidence_0.227_Length_686::g.61424::m.61424
MTTPTVPPNAAGPTSPTDTPPIPTPPTPPLNPNAETDDHDPRPILKTYPITNAPISDHPSPDHLLHHRTPPAAITDVTHQPIPPVPPRHRLILTNHHTEHATDAGIPPTGPLHAQREPSAANTIAPDLPPNTLLSK